MQFQPGAIPNLLDGGSVLKRASVGIRHFGARASPLSNAKRPALFPKGVYIERLRLHHAWGQCPDRTRTVAVSDRFPFFSRAGCSKRVDGPFDRNGPCASAYHARVEKRTAAVGPGGTLLDCGGRAAGRARGVDRRVAARRAGRVFGHARLRTDPLCPRGVGHALYRSPTRRFLVRTLGCPPQTTFLRARSFWHQAFLLRPTRRSFSLQQYFELLTLASACGGQAE